MRALWGRCWEAGGAPAYWPFIEVLRPLIAAAEPQWLAAQLGAGAASVASLCPSCANGCPACRRRLPTTASARASCSSMRCATPARVRAARAARPRASTTCTSRIGRRCACSSSSRAACAAPDADPRARTAPRRRGSRPRLPRCWQASNARASAFRLAAGRTPRCRVHRTAGEEPDPRTVAAVLRASEGTPLFVKEIVRALADSSARGESPGALEVRVPGWAALGDPRAPRARRAWNRGIAAERRGHRRANSPRHCCARSTKRMG